MRTNNTSSSVQLSLFPCQETRENDAPSGNQQIARLSTYLKTCEGLCRLIMLFPDKSVREALSLAPEVLTKCRKEVTL